MFVCEIPRLSGRELEIFTLTWQGYCMREIAEKFNVSQKTDETHRENI